MIEDCRVEIREREIKGAGDVGEMEDAGRRRREKGMGNEMSRGRYGDDGRIEEKGSEDD